jgi:hypothetical protein
MKPGQAMALQNLFASAAPLGEIYPQIAQICTDDAKNCSRGTAARKGEILRITDAWNAGKRYTPAKHGTFLKLF